MRLTSDQRRALRLLAGKQHGIAEPLMLARGFQREMLAELVLAGLVTVVTETMRVGGRPIKVERYRITDDGWALVAGGSDTQ